MREEWNRFRMEIILYIVVTAVLMEMLSLPFVGWSAQFAYGLALGTAVTVVNFCLQAFFCERVLRSGSGMVAALGFPIRMFLYAGAFLVCVKTSGLCGVGAACGFLTLLCGVFYQSVLRDGIHSMIRRRGCNG